MSPTQPLRLLTAVAFFGAAALFSGSRLEAQSLTIPTAIPAASGMPVGVPILLETDGQSLAAMAFSIDFTESCLSFDPTDVDGNAIPDALSFELPPDFAINVLFDPLDVDGEIDISIVADTVSAPRLTDGVLATVSFDLLCSPAFGSELLVPLRFSSAPPASFSDPLAIAVTGSTTDGSISIQTETPVRVGAEFQVNTYTTDIQSDPALTMSDSGEFVVTWSSFGSAFGEIDYGIQGQRYAADGTALGPEFQINSYTTFNQLFSTVAATPDGGFVVAWQSLGPDGSGYGVRSQRFDSGGAPIAGETQVNTYLSGFQGMPKISADAIGDYVIAWWSQGSAGNDPDDNIQVHSFFADGTTKRGDFQVNTYTTGLQGWPAVAAAPGGDFVVVWQSSGSTGYDTSGSSIQGRRFGSDGLPIGGEFQVNTLTVADQYRPAVAMAPGGEFVVVWASPIDASGLSIAGQRFASDGTFLGGELQINTDTAGLQDRPAVISDPSGDFVVVWQSTVSVDDNSGYSVQGQRFGSDGSPAGGQFQVNTFTQLYQYKPAVAGRAGDDFVVTWQSDLSNANDDFFSIQGQRFQVPMSCPDADGDGVCDDDDLCNGDDTTGDTDNDGVCDDIDLCSGDDTTGDTDNDGVCDDVDLCDGDDVTGDTDNDGVCDDNDLCNGDDATGDTDNDGVCDDIDTCLGNDTSGDTDNDGVCDDTDACPGFDDDLDADNDGIPDGCDPCTDSDGDSVCDEDDVCNGVPDSACGDLVATKWGRRLTGPQGQPDITRFVIQVVNRGPSRVNATVIDIFPPELSNARWTCVSNVPMACPPGIAMGDISLVTNLDRNDFVRFVAFAEVASGVPTTNTAEAQINAGFFDPDLTNNIATLPLP